jgi:hypothetical protein
MRDATASLAAHPNVQTAPWHPPIAWVRAIATHRDKIFCLKLADACFGN